VLSLAIMPILAWSKQRTGREMSSRALVADSVETWVYSYLSLALLAGVGLYALFGWWWADPGRRPGHAPGHSVAVLGNPRRSPRTREPGRRRLSRRLC
jgi:hypothetical protein